MRSFGGSGSAGGRFVYSALRVPDELGKLNLTLVRHASPSQTAHSSFIEFHPTSIDSQPENHLALLSVIRASICDPFQTIKPRAILSSYRPR